MLGKMLRHETLLMHAEYRDVAGELRKEGKEATSSPLEDQDFPDPNRCDLASSGGGSFFPS